MDRIDDSIEERLRAAARADPALAERIAALALGTRDRRRPPALILAVGATCVLFLLAAWYWPTSPASRPAGRLHGDAGLVLVRAPDGSSAIFSTDGAEDLVPPGSGFVISEGDTR